MEIIWHWSHTHLCKYQNRQPHNHIVLTEAKLQSTTVKTFIYPWTWLLNMGSPPALRLYMYIGDAFLFFHTSSTTPSFSPSHVPDSLWCLPLPSALSFSFTQTQVSKSSFPNQESLGSCTPHHSHFLSLMLEREFITTNLPRKSPVCAPVLSCNKPFYTSPHQGSLTFPPDSCGAMPMWDPICYIPFTQLCP